MAPRIVPFERAPRATFPPSSIVSPSTTSSPASNRESTCSPKSAFWMIWPAWKERFRRPCTTRYVSASSVRTMSTRPVNGTARCNWLLKISKNASSVSPLFSRIARSPSSALRAASVRTWSSRRRASMACPSIAARVFRNASSSALKRARCVRANERIPWIRDPDWTTTLIARRMPASRAARVNADRSPNSPREYWNIVRP